MLHYTTYNIQFYLTQKLNCTIHISYNILAETITLNYIYPKIIEQNSYIIQHYTSVDLFFQQENKQIFSSKISCYHFYIIK